MYCTIIFQLKGLKPKTIGRTNFYECCDLTKKVYLMGYNSQREIHGITTYTWQFLRRISLLRIHRKAKIDVTLWRSSRRRRRATTRILNWAKFKFIFLRSKTLILHSGKIDYINSTYIIRVLGAYTYPLK